MGDSAPTDPKIDPKIELARLFDSQKCPNLALIIRTAKSLVVTEPAAYVSALEPYSDLLNSIESTIALLVDERNDFESRGKIFETNFQTITHERDALKNNIEQQRKLLERLLHTSGSSSGNESHRRKRLSADPSSKFDAKDGSYYKVQESYETWEAKIRGVFDRDLDYFDTPKLRIGYIADQCDGKAFQFISGHVAAFRGNPDDPELKFHDWEAMLKFMRNQYVTTDSSQFAKDKLDLFFQGNRNYWSWKQELDELFVKARKTSEQKVDLLKTRVNDKIKDMFVTLDDPPADHDYDGWSKKADRFARNLDHRSHLAKLEKGTPHLRNNPIPSPRADLSPAPADTGDPMDLSAAQFGSSRLPQEILDYRRVADLCLACSEPGHVKSAHRYDPQTNPHPLPMPQRTTQHRSFRGTSRGRGNFTPGFRGRGGFNGGNSPFHDRGGYAAQPRPQVYQPQTSWTGAQYQNQYQLRAADYETGQVIGEVQSGYTPTESDNTSQASHDLSRFSTPVSMQSKDQPLR